jgi:hypothetical protein
VELLKIPSATGEEIYCQTYNKNNERSLKLKNIACCKLKFVNGHTLLLFNRFFADFIAIATASSGVSAP